MRPIMRGIAAATLITAAAVAAAIFAKPGPQPEPAAATSAASASTLAEGERLFNASCAACHGAEATGTDRGPPLVHLLYEPSHHGDEAFMLPPCTAAGPIIGPSATCRRSRGSRRSR